MRDTLSNGVSTTADQPHRHRVDSDGDRRCGRRPIGILRLGHRGRAAAPPADAAGGGWKNLSEVTYRTNIRTEATGAKTAEPAADVTGRDADRPDQATRRELEREHRPTRRCSGSATSRRRACASCCRTGRTTSPNLPTITAGAPLQFDAAGGLAGYVPTVPGPTGRTPVALSPGPEPIAAARHILTQGVGDQCRHPDAHASNKQRRLGRRRRWHPWQHSVAEGPSRRWAASHLPAPHSRPRSFRSAVTHAAFRDRHHYHFHASRRHDCDRHTYCRCRPQQRDHQPARRRSRPHSGSSRRAVSSSVRHPVTCTGYTLTTLTGCTLPGNVNLNAVHRSQ